MFLSSSDVSSSRAASSSSVLSMHSPSPLSPEELPSSSSSSSSSSLDVDSYLRDRFTQIKNTDCKLVPITLGTWHIFFPPLATLQMVGKNVLFLIYQICDRGKFYFLTPDFLSPIIYVYWGKNKKLGFMLPTLHLEYQQTASSFCQWYDSRLSYLHPSSS